MFRFVPDDPQFALDLQKLQVTTDQKLMFLLDMVGRNVIAYLRSLTSEMRPPARKGEGSRVAHPGHWADITGNLANAYSYSVDRVIGGVQLSLRNSMEYAVYLEAKDGFFVLSGVLEPGGPLDRELRAIVRKVFPGWTIQEPLMGGS